MLVPLLFSLSVSDVSSVWPRGSSRSVAGSPEDRQLSSLSISVTVLGRQ